MKKQRKILSLILSIALLLISATPLTASAFDSINADDTVELITPSPNAIYSVYGNAAPASLCAELGEMNVYVSNNTLIEILPLDSGTGTVFTITNREDSTVFKDIIIGITSDGQFASIEPLDNTGNLPNASGGGWFWDDLPLIKATAIYNFVYMEDDLYRHFPYMQPQGMYFFYYPNGTDIVSAVRVAYECEGFLFTYPDEIDVSEGYIYQYLAAKEVYNPAANTIYSDAPYFPSNRALNLRNGAPGLGQAIICDIIVNGNHDWAQIPLSAYP